jgi:hypothetical protein
MKWEYRVEVLALGQGCKEHLDSLGRDEWELVSVVAQHLMGNEYIHGFFKRPKSN